MIYILSSILFFLILMCIGLGYLFFNIKETLFNINEIILTSKKTITTIESIEDNLLILTKDKYKKEDITLSSLQKEAIRRRGVFSSLFETLIDVIAAGVAKGQGGGRMSVGKSPLSSPSPNSGSRR